MEGIPKDIFYKSEDTIYAVLEQFATNQMVDQSLIYCFMKAFYLHTVKLYVHKNKTKFDFEAIYQAYKNNLKQYYKINNPTIENELLDHVLDFFDNSFGLIDSLEFSKIEDPYEFRHYTIKVFELLRMLLENKSKTPIREDIFDKQIREILAKKDEILGYLSGKK